MSDVTTCWACPDCGVPVCSKTIIEHKKICADIWNKDLSAVSYDTPVLVKTTSDKILRVQRIGSSWVLYKGPHSIPVEMIVAWADERTQME